MSRAAANGEFVSPFASHEEAVEASAALAKLPLPDSSDDESDGEAGASSGASGAASAQGGGSQRQVQNPSIAARAPGPVPDHVYALMNVTGSDGCCSTSGQGLDLAAQTYLTAEAAAADAVSAFQPKKTDDDDEEEARFHPTRSGPRPTSRTTVEIQSQAPFSANRTAWKSCCWSLAWRQVFLFLYLDG